MFADRTKWNLAPNRLSEVLARHRAEGKPLIDLTASNPTECGFAYDERAILTALQNSAALKYKPEPQGLLSARQAVAEYYPERGVNVHVDNIFLTTSTSEAYSYVFRLLCNPGDEILIPAPSYPLFDFLADIQDVKPVRYPLLYDHGWQIDFHALEQAITPRTRAVIVVHPNNPTGHFTKRAEAEGLTSISAKRGLALIVDEVFLDFSVAPGFSPASLAANRDVLTFTLSGISKICGLPQMKAAWLVVSGPQESMSEAKARLEVLADTFLSMNAPVQLALPTFLSLGHAFQKQLMERVCRNLAELDRQLALQKLCSRLAVEGGWYAVLRAPATRPDEDLALTLLSEKGVYVHPGHFYDFPREGFLVVSLICEETEFKIGLESLLMQFH
ncbi:MAG TPA: pyridoxal phosphate-dependent aminotransferase [Candidatus Acidoferrum sp.]|nr:pyridoxal phosphate-dependent aminotransferase [Candidatus Acidoferrum sp.]